MKLYLAAVYTNNLNRKGKVYTSVWNDRERAAWESMRHVLESYHYISSDIKVKRIREDGKRVFLDSGAFSAFTGGKVIDIRAYAEYIKRNHDILEFVEDTRGLIVMASVLDAIGSAENTWRNQMELERLGVVPLPCFHYGEPEEALCYYTERYPYITLGGMVPIANSQLFYWLDRIWGKYLTHPDGTPKLKVHGFGLTSLALMRRYPWHSVDSSSWTQAALNGGIVLPESRSQIYVSPHSSLAKKDGQHFDNLPRPQKEAIRAKVEAEGFDMERIRLNHYSRFAFNIHIFTKIMDDERVMSKVFKPQQPMLF